MCNRHTAESGQHTSDLGRNTQPGCTIQSDPLWCNDKPLHTNHCAARTGSHDIRLYWASHIVPRWSMRWLVQVQMAHANITTALQPSMHS